MTAAEQEAKIKDIESRLHSFENPQTYTPAAPGMYIESSCSGRVERVHCISQISNVDAAAMEANNAESDSSDDDESSGSESEEE